MATSAEIRSYSRGYQAAANSKWHAHKPPYPPQKEVRQLMESARMLRDLVDSECATFDPDDELVHRLEPGIQAVDDALIAIGQWLKRCGD